MLKETTHNTILVYDNTVTTSKIHAELGKEQKEMQDEVCTKH